MPMLWTIYAIVYAIGYAISYAIGYSISYAIGRDFSDVAEKE